MEIKEEKRQTKQCKRFKKNTSPTINENNKGKTKLNITLNKIGPRTSYKYKLNNRPAIFLTKRTRIIVKIIDIKI